jgi:hypothetical protein
MFIKSILEKSVMEGVSLSSHIRDVLSRRKSDVVNLHEHYDQAVENLLTVARETKKEVRAFTTQDGIHVQAIFAPSNVTFSQGDDIYGPPKYSTSGNVFFLLQRLDDGETLSIPLQDTTSRDSFLKASRASFESILDRQVGLPEFKKGHALNSLTPIRLVTTLPGHQRPSFESRELDKAYASDPIKKLMLESVSSSNSADTRDTLTISSKPGPIVMVGYIGDFPKKIVVSHYRLHDFENMMEAFALTLQDVSDIKALYLEQNKAFYNTIYSNQTSIRRERLPHSMLEAGEGEADIYPEPTLNFICAGKDENTRKYRKEFIDRSYVLLFGSIESAKNIKPMNFSKIQRTMSSIVNSDATKNSFPDENIISIIDNGKYPAKAIAEKFDMPGLSKSQFSKAMNIYGFDNILSSIHISGSKMWNIGDAMKIAKIPQDWLRWEKEGPVLYSPEFSEPDENTKQTLSRLFPYLRATGKKIDELQLLGDKPGIRALTAKWKWLSRSDRSMQDKLDGLEREYKINATFNDYSTLITNMTEAVILRTLSEHTELHFDDAVEVLGDTNDLEIDEGKVTDIYKEYLDDKWSPEEDSQELMRDVYWDCLENEPTVLSDYEMSSLTSFNDLVNEGMIPEHETIDLIPRCLLGCSAIILIKNNLTQERISTLEIDISYNQDTPIYSVFQYLGSGMVDDDLKDVVRNWIDSINYGETLVNDILHNTCIPEPVCPSEDTEDFGLPGVSQLMEQVLDAAPDIKTVLDLNKKIHSEYSQFVKEVNSTSNAILSWVPVHDEPNLYEGYEFRSISNRLDLLEEGVIQDNCVFGYLGKCLSGESRIISIRDQKTKERIATLEINPCEDESYDNYTYEVGQCFGAKNSSVSNDVDEIVERWVEGINEGTIPHNAIDNDDMCENTAIEDVIGSPLEKGHLLKTIPYNTDAAHLSYFLIERYLPKGVDAETLMGGTSKTTLDIFYDTPFSADIQLIKKISLSLKQQPVDIVRFKIKNNLKSFSDVPAFYQAQTLKETIIEDVICEYRDDMTNEQIAYKINEVLFNKNSESFNSDDLVMVLDMDTSPRDIVSTLKTQTSNAENAVEIPDTFTRNVIESKPECSRYDTRRL